MTPLAYKILKAEPEAMKWMIDIAFIDFCEVMPALKAFNDATIQVDGKPAPYVMPKLPWRKTWLEFRFDHVFKVPSVLPNNSTMRGALFMTQTSDDHIEVEMVNVDFPPHIADTGNSNFSYNVENWNGTPIAVRDPYTAGIQRGLSTLGISALRMINERHISYLEAQRQTKRFRQAVKSHNPRDVKVTYHIVRLGTDPVVRSLPKDGRPTGIVRALHATRGHYRRYKSGRVAWVKPHWRGSAEKGVALKSYKVDPDA
jgi:hypothetical protein